MSFKRDITTGLVISAVFGAVSIGHNIMKDDCRNYEYAFQATEAESKMIDLTFDIASGLKNSLYVFAGMAGLAGVKARRRYLTEQPKPPTIL